MKSYLRFLSRNKLYTAIEIVGLSLALAFVIVLSAYIMDDMSVNKSLENTDDIHICYSSYDITSIYEVPGLYEKFPEIGESCSFFARSDGNALISGASIVTYGNTEINVATAAASENFFDFFTFPLAHGNPESALQSKYSVIISEELAGILFPDEEAIGKEIRFFEGNAYSGYYTEMTDIDVKLTVTGVFKPFSKTIFNEPDMLISIDLFRELQKVNFCGMMHISELSFVRIAKGTDSEALAEKLTEEYRKTPNQSGEDPYSKVVKLTKFDDIKKIAKDEDPGAGFFFRNLRNVKLFGIYLIMCIFLTIVALLDYVVLTIAFSRFRIKEIATRQLLGTDRRGIINRCFCEAFALLLASCIIAVLIALGFKEPVGRILGTEIHPLSHINEYMVLMGILLLMGGLASAVPSMILSSYSAINVIKGEARYKDKTIFGKLFIGIAGLLSIGALSICFGINRQTRHLINQPLGYETEGVILVSFLDKDAHRFYDELKTQPYVSKIGSYINTPDGTGASVIADKNGNSGELRVLEGDHAYFDILGIDIVEEFSPATDAENLYLCKSTYESITEFRYDNMINYMWRDTPVCGIVTDLKLGSILEETAGKFMGISIFNDFTTTTGRQICIKTDMNINETIRQIKEFYYSKGYNDDIFFVNTLMDSLQVDIREEQNILKLLSGFSILCILMTVMTIVGLSSYHAKSNEKDNAVRNVFGCSRKELVMKLVFDFVLPVLISAIVAIPVAWSVIDRWLEGYAIRTDNSPAIYISALAVILAIVIAAISAQAFRLMRTNPAEVLKKE